MRVNAGVFILRVMGATAAIYAFVLGLLLAAQDLLFLLFMALLLFAYIGLTRGSLDKRETQ
jgi:hypothetical protein